MTKRVNPEQESKLKAEVVETAEGIGSGKLGVVAGVRVLVGLAHRIGADREPDFLFLIGVDSESDHFPIGEIRHRWNISSLKEKDLALAAFEESMRDRVHQVCRRLIERYSPSD